MSERLIKGVHLTPLRKIDDERGCVLHMLRSDSPLFHHFGEVYFSKVYAYRVKAWKRHKRMTQNFAVPVGSLHIVLYDDREASPTRGLISEFEIGVSNYSLITIPPQVWYGFQAVGGQDALICNCTDLPHDPGESETQAWNAAEIPFLWQERTTV